ncbi:hypothetical protein D7243_03255 [Stutzerimonas stutzeri]|nr:hypothetical protein [Stutzerimonas stutzeri]
MHIPRAERGRDPERAVFAVSVVSCLAAVPHEASARMLVNRELLSIAQGHRQDESARKNHYGGEEKITAAPAAGAPWPAVRSRCSPKCPDARRSPPG